MLRALCPHRRREAALYIAKMVRGRAQRKRYAELQRLRQALAALLRSAPQRARRHRRSARSTAGSAANPNPNPNANPNPNSNPNPTQARADVPLPRYPKPTHRPQDVPISMMTSWMREVSK